MRTPGWCSRPSRGISGLLAENSKFSRHPRASREDTPDAVRGDPGPGRQVSGGRPPREQVGESRAWAFGFSSVFLNYPAGDTECVRVANSGLVMEIVHERARPRCDGNGDEVVTRPTRIVPARSKRLSPECQAPGLLEARLSVSALVGPGMTAESGPTRNSPGSL